MNLATRLSARGDTVVGIDNLERLLSGGAETRPACGYQRRTLSISPAGWNSPSGLYAGEAINIVSDLIALDDKAPPDNDTVKAAESTSPHRIYNIGTTARKS